MTEIGYPITAASRSQVAGTVEERDLIAEFLGEIEWFEQFGNTKVHRVPSGVVGAITAWNAPLRSVISKAGAAMAAGCTVGLEAVRSRASYGVHLRRDLRPGGAAHRNVQPRLRHRPAGR